MHRVEPKVFLIGETVVTNGLFDYLEHVGTSWRPSHAVSSDAERLVEVMGRLCYRSWEPGLNANVTKIREENRAYLHNIIQSKHGSVLEHPVTHWIFADVSRVFTHELVRHRAGVAVSQESLRYVRLTDLGLWLPEGVEHHLELSMLFEQTFQSLEALQLRMAEELELDRLPFSQKKQWTSAMRRVAPIGLSTTIGVSVNMRALRHIAEMRTSVHAEEEIRLVIDQVMSIAVKRWPGLFQDFKRNHLGEWYPEVSKV